MSTRMVHVGFKNYLSAGRIIAIAMPSSAPIKRSVLDARDKGLCIDLTNGRRVKAVVFLDSIHVALSALETATVSHRMAEAEVNE